MPTTKASGGRNIASPSSALIFPPGPLFSVIIATVFICTFVLSTLVAPTSALTPIFHVKVGQRAVPEMVWLVWFEALDLAVYISPGSTCEGYEMFLR